jgi:uncharacterized membrane protein
VAAGTFTTYQGYLSIHILAAVIWVGTAFATQVYAIRAQRSGNAGHLAAFSGDVEWLGTRVFVPSSLILVIFGFLLVHESHWQWKLWLVVALVVWVASFITGAAFLGPESGRIQKTIEEKGVESEDAQARLKRIFLVSRIELVFLVLIVLDMTLKPGS